MIRAFNQFKEIHKALQGKGRVEAAPDAAKARGLAYLAMRATQDPPTIATYRRVKPRGEEQHTTVSILNGIHLAGTQGMRLVADQSAARLLEDMHKDALAMGLVK